MNWWNDALYDGCSLVTLDRVLRDHAGVRPHFPSVLTVQECLAAGQVREESATRIARFARFCPLPPLRELRRILAAGRLPLALADVDRLIYAAAVHHRQPVVTADGNLGIALSRAKVQVGSLAGVLNGLVETSDLSQPENEGFLSGSLIGIEVGGNGRRLGPAIGPTPRRPGRPACEKRQAVRAPAS